MNNEMMYQMLLNMVDKMNDSELENSLEKLKTLVSPDDYEKIHKMVEERRRK